MLRAKLDFDSFVHQAYDHALGSNPHVFEVAPSISQNSIDCCIGGIGIVVEEDEMLDSRSFAPYERPQANWNVPTPCAIGAVPACIAHH